MSPPLAEVRSLDAIEVSCRVIPNAESEQPLCHETGPLWPITGIPVKVTFNSSQVAIAEAMRNFSDADFLGFLMFGHSCTIGEPMLECTTGRSPAIHTINLRAGLSRDSQFDG